jgi:hypothetical protein
MKSMKFTHNDDAKCFHMVVQGTHKLVVMGHINFKDHALIKRWQANEKKMMGGMFKDMKKWCNHRKQFAFIVGSCVRFWIFGVHNNMSVDSAIEKLYQIAREKEA